MEKPKTTQGILDALWYAVVGLNEKDGLIGVSRQLRDDMVILKANAPLLWTRAEHYKERHADEDRIESKTEEKKNEQTQHSMSAATWVASAVAICALIVAVIAMVKR
jgi:hypothetical protein